MEKCKKRKECKKSSKKVNSYNFIELSDGSLIRKIDVVYTHPIRYTNLVSGKTFFKAVIATTYESAPAISVDMSEEEYARLKEQLLS